VIGVGLVVLVTPGVTWAQRRGGGGGPALPSADQRTRLEILTDALKLDRDQRNAVRATFDAAFKDAAPIRTRLAETRTALAVAATTDPSGIPAAARAYADASAAMTALETRALGEVLTSLPAEQRRPGTATAFYLMRGIFLDSRRWDEMPRGRNY
jgi:hypothetical protein